MENKLTISEFASLGGKASAANLTKKQRIARARKAGKAGGWPKGKPRKVKEMHEAIDILKAKMRNNE